MARINVEDSIFKDIRFIELIGKEGSLNAALGLLVRSWMIAQTYYLNEETRRMIPVEAWQRQKLGNHLLEVGFAKQVDNYIYVSGSEEQFAWLLQRQEAGRRGGLAKSNKNDSGVAGAKQNEAKPSKRKPLSLSLSLSPSLTLSQSPSQTQFQIQEDINSGATDQQPKPTKRVRTSSPAGTPKTSRLFETYAKVYWSKYKVEIKPSAKLRGQMSQMIDRIGEEDALKVIKFYLDHTDAFYLKKTHDFGLCLKDCETLRTQMLRGIAVTSRKVREFEREESYNDTLQAIRSGELSS